MHIQQITGQIKIVTGLHIGGADTTIKIGGIDSSVVKNPVTNYPTIPGSSLKGKIRSLLEMYAGHNGEDPVAPKDVDKCIKSELAKPELAKDILKLFGTRADAGTHDYGVSRLSFYDCDLCSEWAEQQQNNDNLSASLTEEKAENVINRITGTAQHPRRIERVPAGAVFGFTLNIRYMADDNREQLLQTLLTGLKLLTLDSLGGSGSRGYGKVDFKNLRRGDDTSLQQQLDALDLFVGKG